jgi:hypothetical protein
MKVGTSVATGKEDLEKTSINGSWMKASPERSKIKRVRRPERTPKRFDSGSNNYRI